MILKCFISEKIHNLINSLDSIYIILLLPLAKATSLADGAVLDTVNPIFFNVCRDSVFLNSLK